MSATTLAQATLRPSNPTALTITSVTHNSFTCNYTVTASVSRPITAVILRALGRGTASLPTQTIPRTTSGSGSFTFTGAAPSSTYRVSLNVRNSVGEAIVPITRTVRTLATPPPPPPPEPPAPPPVVGSAPDPPAVWAARPRPRTATFTGTGIEVDLTITVTSPLKIVESQLYAIYEGRLPAEPLRTETGGVRVESGQSRAFTNILLFHFLKPSTLYTVGVELRNRWGSVVRFIETTTLDDLNFPAPPAPVVSGSGTLTGIEVAWTPGAGQAATSWEIRLGAAAWIPIADADARSFSFSGLTPGTVYAISVRGLNSQTRGAIGSALIATASPGAAGVPGAPVLSTTVGDTWADVAWTPTGVAATGWEYRLDAGPWTRIPGGGEVRSVRLSGLTPSIKYSVLLRGANDFGEGVAANASFETLAAAVARAPRIAHGPRLVAQSGEIDLRFTVTDTGGSPITRYEFQREDAGTPGAWTAFTPVVLGPVLGYEDSTVTNGIQYRYRVRATNASGTGTSPWSDYATPTDASTPPDRISRFYAEATGAAGEALLISEPARTSADAPVTRNEYRFSTDDGATWGPWTAEAGTPSDTELHRHTVTGLAANVLHWFQIRGVNRRGAAEPTEQVGPVIPGEADGDFSDPDPVLPVEMDATPAPAPSEPSGVALTGGVRWTCTMAAPYFDQTIFSWDWAAVALDGTIGAAAEVPSSRGATTVSFDQTGLAAGTRHRVVFRIRSSEGVGLWSPASPFVLVSAAPTVPPAPDKPDVTPANAALYVRWASNGDGNSAITKWQLRWRVKGAAAWGAWMDAAGRTQGDAVQSSRISGLTNGSDYEVQVRGVNAVGNGAASPTSTD